MNKNKNDIICPISDITCPYSCSIGLNIYCTLDDMTECDDYCYYDDIPEEKE